VNPGPTATRAPDRARAAALPPEARRAHIIEATLPLLLEHGATITTRQIAEAAGIAEGTIFRVFPDKESLVAAVVEAAIDTTNVDAALDAIDPALPLETRLGTAVDLLRARLVTVLQLRAVVGGPTGGPSTDVSKIAKVFAPDADRLRRTPTECAHLLRGLTFACTHAALIGDAPLGSDEIVSLLLDGVRATTASPDLQDPTR
jgi:AcrR family transcriptional regulator